MSFLGVQIKIPDLNPLRFAQKDMIDTNYRQSMFRNTIFSTTSNKMKYLQKYAVGDIIRCQLSKYGSYEAGYTGAITATIFNIDGSILDTFAMTEKTGTWNNGYLEVYEFAYTADTEGEFYFEIDVSAENEGTGVISHVYFISEPIYVAEIHKCLPKIIYYDSKNYPAYDMYFSTGILCQIRAELGVNQKPETDIISHTNQIKDFISLHSTMYDSLEVYSTTVLPIWMTRKIKFALAVESCFLNYEQISLISNDEIEQIEDGFMGCTFKFKCQYRNNTMSISANASNYYAETTKDFNDLCSSDSALQPCGCGGVIFATDYFDPAVTKTLTVAGWESNMQDVAVSFVSGINDILIVGTTINDRDAIEYYGITAVQTEGVLTFECVEVPTMDININIKKLV